MNLNYVIAVLLQFPQAFPKARSHDPSPVLKTSVACAPTPWDPIELSGPEHCCFGNSALNILASRQRHTFPSPGPTSESGVSLPMGKKHLSMPSSYLPKALRQPSEHSGRASQVRTQFWGQVCSAEHGSVLAQTSCIAGKVFALQAAGLGLIPSTPEGP